MFRRPWIAFTLALVCWPGVGRTQAPKSNRLETIRGTVVEVVPLSQGRDAGLNIKLRTESGDYEVHVGPQLVKPYKNSPAVSSGDEIQVVGITFNLGELASRKKMKATEFTKLK